MATFDAYYNWLGVPPVEQPPNSYRLLGLTPFEDNREVIANAADRQMAFIRQFQAGPHGAHSQRLLNEIAAARARLLNPRRKAEYDANLKLQVSFPPPRASSAAIAGSPPPVPVAPLPNGESRVTRIEGVAAPASNETAPPKKPPPLPKIVSTRSEDEAARTERRRLRDTPVVPFHFGGWGEEPEWRVNSPAELNEKAEGDEANG